MELLYVYEDKIAEDLDGNYYVGSAFSQEVFDRYLKHFEHITLLMRHSDIKPDDNEALSRMNKIDSTNIDVVFLPNLTAGIKNYINPKIAREYRKIIIDNITPDRAVIVRAPSNSGRVAVKHCNKIGKPVLVEAVGCPWDSMWNYSFKGKVLAPDYWARFRETMSLATHAVYVTSEFLQKRYPTKGKQVAISDVELQPMDDEVLKNRIKKIENHSSIYKIGTAAAVNVGFKGQQFVIEALAKLKAEGMINFEYHLAGGGDNSALKNLAERLGISEQVIFEGSLPHDKMFAWLDDMDLYIQPSLQEGLPRAVVEAMSRGLPIFGSMTGGIPELISPECIFHRKDVDEIKNKLQSIKKESMLSMAKTNFEHAKMFEKERLEKLRYEFYSAFAKESEERKT